jgi:hypothetical protein
LNPRLCRLKACRKTNVCYTPITQTVAAERTNSAGQHWAAVRDTGRPCPAFNPSAEQDLVPEVPASGERHRRPGLIAGGDHLGVAHRAAGLNQRRHARLDRHLRPVWEREEGV